MEFRDPLFMILLVLIPWLFLRGLRSPNLIRYSSLDLLRGTPRSLRARLTFLPSLLNAMAMACMVVAVAGPRTPNAETKISREGIAIMAVVDRSGSMHARDLVKNDLSVDRLAVVKDVFRQFVLGGQAGTGRPDDMIGLIAFAGYADSLCPLTLDHGNLITIADDLQIARQRDEDGTAIGDGLALAVERIRQSTAKSKVIVLLTDGVNNTGVVTPEQAADLAAAEQIRVYCIGAGTNGLAPYPVIDPFSGRERLEPIRVEIDDESLRKLAEKTGGRFFRATDKEGLARVYAEIDQLEKTKVTEQRFLQYTEHYAGLLMAALGMLVAAIVGGGTWLRALP
ncbi:MAG: VWA domain-containing protein [Planctomycetes bacterium]|nr:VWA domain-containing protein [Planctomycetota bacterium]